MTRQTLAIFTVLIARGAFSAVPVAAQAFSLTSTSTKRKRVSRR